MSKRKSGLYFQVFIEVTIEIFIPNTKEFESPCTIFDVMGNLRMSRFGAQVLKRGSYVPFTNFLNFKLFS